MNEVKKMIIKNEKTMLIVGTFSLLLGILIGALNIQSPGFSISDFIAGILIGISLVMNLTYLIRRRQMKSRPCD